MTAGAFHTKIDPSLAHVTICRPSGLMRTCHHTGKSRMFISLSVEDHRISSHTGKGKAVASHGEVYSLGEAKVSGPTLLMVPECPLPTASTTPSSHDHNYTSQEARGHEGEVASGGA